MTAEKGRLRRVGTRMVKPAPAMVVVEPLNLAVPRDEGDGPSLRDILADYGPLVLLLVVVGILAVAAWYGLRWVLS
ncbi:hypothetical protein OOJ91_11940 [Micromonospora lupini]|uniref:hypothetical protein n=1 Tax=Micromonospora lupini TaxID=285679 RepID=UPI0022588BA4|nr:hypothetical protein [Micromonospora lupini]MCX5066588.1 hypothetical protein [Micromonospora lupini]